MKVQAKIGSLMLATFLASGCSFSTSGAPDGGVYKSNDKGAAFVQKVKISETENFAASNVLSMAIDSRKPEVIYAGTDRDGILRSVDSGETWVKDINGFTNVASIALHPSDDQIIYVAAQKGKRGKILKTDNGGQEWKEVFTESVQGPLVSALAVNKNVPGVVYAGDTSGSVYKTEDGGATWRTIFRGKSVVSRIIFDEVNSASVYFATKGSGLFKCVDGCSQEPIQTGLDGVIYNVVAHPYQENILFASDTNGLQKSVDGGVTWNLINTLVAPEKLASKGLAVNPRNENEIYYASGGAFYKSENGGATWTPVQLDVTRGVEIIAIDPINTSNIYLGMRKASRSAAIFPF